MLDMIARALKEGTACSINENRHGRIRWEAQVVTRDCKATNNSPIISERNRSWTKPVIGITREQKTSNQHT